MRTYVLFLISLIGCLAVQGQTLAIGDIAFTGMNTANTPTDDFSFIVLRPGGIAAGTKIRFTDKGWQSGSCTAPTWGTTAESEIEWTAGSALAYGAQVRIYSNGGAPPTLSASNGTVTLTNGTIWSLIQGDQLFALQGTFTTPTVMIAGIHMNLEIGSGGVVLTSASNWDNMTITNGSSSNRPTCLTNGLYAFYFSQSVNDRTNARLKASVQLTGTKATDLALINNDANWDSNNGTAASDAYSLPVVFNVSLPVKFTFVRIVGSLPKIEWEVAEELNVKEYVVERSSDGIQYSAVATIAASGATNYAWSDPLSVLSFYRIKAVDADGMRKYSAVIKFSPAKEKEAFQVTRAQTGLLVTLSQMQKGTYEVWLLTYGGSLVQKFLIRHAGGTGVFQLPAHSQLAKGLYLVQLTSQQTSHTARILLD